MVYLVRGEHVEESPGVWRAQGVLPFVTRSRTDGGEGADESDDCIINMKTGRFESVSLYVQVRGWSLLEKEVPWISEFIWKVWP